MHRQCRKVISWCKRCVLCSSCHCICGPSCVFLVLSAAVAVQAPTLTALCAVSTCVPSHACQTARMHTLPGVPRGHAHACDPWDPLVADCSGCQAVAACRAQQEFRMQRSRCEVHSVEGSPDVPGGQRRWAAR